jgi:hypothetical protein
MTTAWRRSTWRAGLRLGLRLGLGVCLCVCLCVALAVGGALVVLQRAPLVARASDISSDDVGKAVALARLHDPRRTPPGQSTTLHLSERDVDVLLNEGAKRWLRGAVRVSMQPQQAQVHLSVPVPANPIGPWLNVQLALQETTGLPQVTSLQIGGLAVPAPVGMWLGRWGLQHAGLTTELNLARDLIKHVDFAPQRVTVRYVLTPDSTQRMLAAVLPPGEQQRLRVYSERMVTLAATQPAFTETSMARWLGPMFELARQRTLAGADAAAENRSAILSLTLYVSGRGAGSLFPNAHPWPHPNPLKLTLNGRDDFPMHWLISAALAMEGAGPLSKAFGVWKEVADAREGSGFSFNDIAADRAGTRLGEMAISQPQLLQDRLARGVQDSDVMPAWADLPEFLTEPELKRRFGGVGAPPYLALLAEIDRRVSALPALR